MLESDQDIIHYDKAASVELWHEDDLSHIDIGGIMR